MCARLALLTCTQPHNLCQESMHTQGSHYRPHLLASTFVTKLMLVDPPTEHIASSCDTRKSP